VEHATVFDVRSGELAQAIQQWFPQGKVNGETLSELMYFDMHVSPKELPTALSIQASRLSDMAFTDATLQREIPRTLVEVQHLIGQPNGMGKFALIPLVQGAIFDETNVPFRRLSKDLTVDDVRAFHAANFCSDASSLSVIGDFDAAAIRKQIERDFGPIRRPTETPVVRPTFSPGFKRVTWDTPKRHFWLAWTMPGPSQPDQPALLLAAMLLQQKLFAQHQTGALSSLPTVHHDLDSMLLIGCEVADDDGFMPMRKALMTEVTSFSRDGGVASEELKGAIAGMETIAQPEAMLGHQPLPPGVSRTMARVNLELQRLRHETIVGDFDAYVARLRKVKLSELRHAAAKWLTPEKVLAVRVVPSPSFDKK